MSHALSKLNPRSTLGRAVRRLREAMTRDPGAALRRVRDFTSRFRSYSPLNSFLVWLQRPDATLVAGRKRWAALGHRVRKGARAICVQAPRLEPGVRGAARRFRPVRVYDRTDLESPLPEVPCLHPPEGPGAVAERLVADLEAWICGSGLSLVEGRPWLNATCWGATDGCTVWVLPELRGAQRAAVLAHEIAHARLHFRGRRGEGPIEVDGPEGLPPGSRRELEAELTAFLLLALRGVDSSEGSAAYLRSWQADPAAVDAALLKALVTACGTEGQMRRRSYSKLVADHGEDAVPAMAAPAGTTSDAGGVRRRGRRGIPGRPGSSGARSTRIMAPNHSFGRA